MPGSVQLLKVIGQFLFLFSKLIELDVAEIWILLKIIIRIVRIRVFGIFN